MKQRMLTRSCGFCNACCVNFSVEAIGKPEYTPCQHLKCGIKKGCSIYQERPAVCESFFCEWVLGHIGTENDRPDKIGVMYHYRSGTAFAKIILIADEVRDGAFLEPQAHTLTSAIGESELVLLRTKTTRKVIGPPHEMGRVKPIIEGIIKNANQRSNPDNIAASTHE